MNLFRISRLNKKSQMPGLTWVVGIVALSLISVIYMVSIFWIMAFNGVIDFDKQKVNLQEAKALESLELTNKLIFFLNEKTWFENENIVIK